VLAELAIAQDAKALSGGATTLKESYVVGPEPARSQEQAERKSHERILAV
jgi:hypothetical protein